MPHALALVSAASVAGGLLLAVAAAMQLMPGSRAPALYPRRAEWWLLVASITAATVGALMLFVVPFGTVVSGGGRLSTPGTVELLTSNVGGRTFYQSSDGSGVVLFTLPVAISLLPLAFTRRAVRPLVQALCAAALGAQAAIGMSGYGLAFAPSALLMLAAGLAAAAAARR